MRTKYIFITGGVVSSLGKGITAASLGRLLKARGYKVAIQKFDPYINIDPGRMSPYQHGEVFVTEDGAEADLDLGHYERFTDENLNRYSSVTSGKVYWNVLNTERQGGYEGATVQVIPHITDEIKRRVYILGENNDVVITEIGGTVGDIESLPFLEAIRQLKYEMPGEDILYVHMTLIPYLQAAGELKTKPTQHSVKELQSQGIQPHIIICRSPQALSQEVKDKIGLFCNIPSDNVFHNLDAESIYEIPLYLEADGLAEKACEILNLPSPEPDLDEWRAMVEKDLARSEKLKIALVGKYVELKDAYISACEAMEHVGIELGIRPEIKWINAEELNEANSQELLGDVHGLILPSGFGSRGLDGMIEACRYARESKLPFFGIGFGMQAAGLEFARHILGYEDANSTEFDPGTSFPVIDIDPHDKSMRLGAQKVVFNENSKFRQLYGTDTAMERHRHRYDFCARDARLFEEKGMLFSGLSEDLERVETLEIPDHPFYLACQYHPEFKSRPTKPHPLFRAFIKAALEHR
ncbi:MAG: CTP synthase [Tissierellia bacterium]|nr:CTP synthase [Tissierellia bacterium]